VTSQSSKAASNKSANAKIAEQIMRAVQQLMPAGMALLAVPPIEGLTGKPVILFSLKHPDGSLIQCTVSFTMRPNDASYLELWVTAGGWLKHNVVTLEEAAAVVFEAVTTSVQRNEGNSEAYSIIVGTLVPRSG
jgi:hypothetical protein